MSSKLSVKTKLRRSINEAVKAGTLDKQKHGGAINAALKLAEIMDTPGWPIMGKHFDNVTPSTLLKYCQILHIVPADVIPGKDEEEDGLIGNSKWKKTASDES